LVAKIAQSLQAIIEKSWLTSHAIISDSLTPMESETNQIGEFLEASTLLRRCSIRRRLGADIVDVVSDERRNHLPRHVLKIVG
jgi:hypothetical protein